MPAHDASIKRIEGPAISTDSGHVAKTVKLKDITDDIMVTLHVEVVNADEDDPTAWKTAIEAISPGYVIVDW